MNRDLDLLRTYGQATAPVPARVREVSDRLRARGCLTSQADESLQALPAPGPAAVARVQGALAEHLARAPRTLTRRASWPALAVAAAVALAMVVLLPQPDRVLSERLVSPASWQERAPTTDVALRFQGTGSLEGTAHAPTIEWEAGRLEVAVVPGREVHLVVETREARITVTGTAFTVERSGLGSGVSVREGTVEVACRDAAPVAVGAGRSQDCPPVSAAGWMARANLLEERGASLTEVLSSTESGLRLGDAPDAVIDELGAIRVRALAGLGRHAEALEAAEAYLGRGHPTREDEVRRLAIRAARQVGGCARARPHIEAMATDDAEAAALLAACTRGGPP